MFPYSLCLEKVFDDSQNSCHPMGGSCAFGQKVWTRTRPNLVSGQARFQSVCFDRILYSNTANSRPKGHGFEPHRGVWGLYFFFCMRKLGPSIYLSPPKISGISSTQKIFTRAYVYMKISEYPHALGSVLAYPVSQITLPSTGSILSNTDLSDLSTVGTCDIFVYQMRHRVM